MNEEWDIRSLATEELVYDVIYVWIRFPNRIVLFAQSEGETPRRISCRDCLSNSLQLFDKMNTDYGENYEAMLIKQVGGEKANIKLFLKDPTKNGEDVKRTIISFL